MVSLPFLTSSSFVTDQIVATPYLREVRTGKVSIELKLARKPDNGLTFVRVEHFELRLGSNGGARFSRYSNSKKKTRSNRKKHAEKDKAQESTRRQRRESGKERGR